MTILLTCYRNIVVVANTSGKRKPNVYVCCAVAPVTSLKLGGRPSNCHDDRNGARPTRSRTSYVEESRGYPRFSALRGADCLSMLIANRKDVDDVSPSVVSGWPVI